MAPGPRAGRPLAGHRGALVRGAGAAARHRGLDRPPRITQLDRGLARHPGRRLPGCRPAGGAVLRRHRAQRRARRGPARPGRVPPLHPDQQAAAGARCGRAACVVHRVGRNHRRGRGDVHRTWHCAARARGRGPRGCGRRPAPRLGRAAGAAGPPGRAAGGIDPGARCAPERIAGAARRAVGLLAGAEPALQPRQPRRLPGRLARERTRGAWHRWLPSDGDAESAALQEDGPRHGDDPAAAARRVPRGHVLLAERFGGTAPAPGEAPGINIDAARDAAATEAARLWSRMAEL